MKENIEVFGPLVAVIAYCLLLWVVLHARGFSWLRWQITPERARPWRRLRRWQFVVVYGIGTVTIPVLLFFLSRAFLEHRLDIYHKPEHSDIVFPVLVFIPLGIWQGLGTWKKIWQHEYDLPN